MVTRIRPTPSQILQAWFCLLAAIVLLAPFAGAACSAHAAACCTGDHCPIPEHHHSKAPAYTSECEHQTAMTDCSMKCCQSSDRPLLGQIAFVLPAPASLATPDAATTVAAVLKSNRLPRSSEVLSPPPRVSRFAL